MKFGAYIFVIISNSIRLPSLLIVLSLLDLFLSDTWLLFYGSSWIVELACFVVKFDI